MHAVAGCFEFVVDRAQLDPLSVFLQVPGQPGPYIARMLPEVIADGVMVQSGATVTLTGRVQAMANADSVADAWIAAGAISEGDRILVLVAEGGSFLEVEDVVINAEPEPEEDN